MTFFGLKSTFWSKNWPFVLSQQFWPKICVFTQMKYSTKTTVYYSRIFERWILLWNFTKVVGVIMKIWYDSNVFKLGDVDQWDILSMRPIRAHRKNKGQRLFCRTICIKNTCLVLCVQIFIKKSVIGRRIAVFSSILLSVFFAFYEVSSNLARLLLFFNGFRHVYTILCACLSLS